MRFVALVSRDHLRLVLGLVLEPAGDRSIDVLGVRASEPLDQLFRARAHGRVGAVHAAESAGVGLGCAEFLLQPLAADVGSFAKALDVLRHVRHDTLALPHLEDALHRVPAGLASLQRLLDLAAQLADVGLMVLVQAPCDGHVTRPNASAQHVGGGPLSFSLRTEARSGDVGEDGREGLCWGAGASYGCGGDAALDDGQRLSERSVHANAGDGLDLAPGRDASDVALHVGRDLGVDGVEAAQLPFDRGHHLGPGAPEDAR